MLPGGTPWESPWRFHYVTKQNPVVWRCSKSKTARPVAGQAIIFAKVMTRLGARKDAILRR